VTNRKAKPLQRVGF